MISSVFPSCRAGDRRGSTRKACEPDRRSPSNARIPCRSTSVGNGDHGAHERAFGQVALGWRSASWAHERGSGKAALGCCGFRGGAPRQPHANGRASRVHGTLGPRVPTRPAWNSLPASPIAPAGRGPLFGLAGNRAQTLGALGNAAEESSPAPPARRAWLLSALVRASGFLLLELR
jgi:hypothetical protein